MIVFLSTGKHAYAIGEFLRSWGADLADGIRIVPYHVLPSLWKMPVATYIFTDMERLTPAQLTVACWLWDKLAASGKDVRLLNHPGRCPRRLDLLRLLHARGVNSFAAYHAAEVLAVRRFPVFLRRASDHAGSISPLLHNQTEVNDAVMNYVMSGEPFDDLLAIEFCDTGRDGLYRKYGIFRIGPHILPRHLLVSAEWMSKTKPCLIAPPYLAEELEYLAANPHEKEVRAIFELAGIEYGRLDYSIKDGKIQVWEINTNPCILHPPEEYRPPKIPAKEAFARMVRPALQSVDCSLPPSPLLFKWDANVLRA